MTIILIDFIHNLTSLSSLSLFGASHPLLSSIYIFKPRAMTRTTRTTNLSWARSPQHLNQGGASSTTTLAVRNLGFRDFGAAWSQAAAWTKLSFGGSGARIRVWSQGWGWEAFLVATEVPMVHVQHSDIWPWSEQWQKLGP